MENNKKLQMFVNDTYDVLAGNSEYCTQEEYSKDMVIMKCMLIVKKTLLSLMIFKLQLH